MTSATLSDLFRKRFMFILPTIAISLTGFIILVAVHDNKHLQYAALFLAASGTYSAMPIIVCWFATNCEQTIFHSLHIKLKNRCLATVGGHHRRAVGTAWQVGFGNSK